MIKRPIIVSFMLFLLVSVPASADITSLVRKADRLNDAESDAKSYEEAKAFLLAPCAG